MTSTADQILAVIDKHIAGAERVKSAPLYKNGVPMHILMQTMQEMRSEIEAITPEAGVAVTDARVEAAARSLCGEKERDQDVPIYAGPTIGVVPVWKIYEEKARAALIAALAIPAKGPGK